MKAQTFERTLAGIVAVLIAVAVVVGFAGTAHAGWRDFQDAQGGADLHYELSGFHTRDEMGGPRDLVLAGARLHGFIGGARLGYHMGLDLAAGGTINGGGFAYDVSIFPVGLAVRLFDTSFVSLGAGVGASGATGVLDDATTLPLEARFELGRGIRVLGRARATYLFATNSARQGGARVADELEAMLAVRLGSAYNDYGFPTGNGYFVGAMYREALGAQFFGAVIGYSIDMSTRRRHREVMDDMSRGCDGCE
jgi:hypothetical protein